MQKKLMLVSIVALVLILSFSVFTLACPAPQVSLVSPDKGHNNETVDIVITGAKFHKSAYVKLIKSGEEEIVGANLQITKTQLTCTLDLRGKALGSWDLVVGNIGSMSKKEKPTVLTNGFTIVAAGTTIKEEPKKEEPKKEEPKEEKPVVKDDPNKDLKSIYFDFDDASVRKDQFEFLDENIKILKKNAKLKVILGGHADDRGTAEYNLDLSQRRAEAVKEYLIEKGISASRITVFAYGEEYPAVEGQNESAWAYNRRVDVSLWEFVPAKENALK